MIYLLLSILCSTIILLLFRWIPNSRANTRHAIVINYASAAVTGFLIYPFGADVVDAPWFWPASLLGIWFYGIFRLIAKTTQVSGVGTASVATRMSVIIPVCVGLFVLNESVTIIKLLGIALGLVAVVMSSSGSLQSRQWIWPLLAFLGSGSVDVSLKLFQEWSVPDEQFTAFSVVIFGFAFLAGLGHHLFTQNRTMNMQSITVGIGLGVVNFGSIFFILNTLALPNWESSVVFPINNIGVVTAASIAAIFLFRERPGWRGVSGLALAILAIVLLAYAV